MKIDEYVIPDSIEKAYELLISDSRNCILAGGIGLSRNNTAIHTAIEMKRLLSADISLEGDEVVLGALLTFHSLEMKCSEFFTKENATTVKQSVSETGGAQLRNHITVGGAICSKFGPSDFITLLAAFDAQLVWYHKGRMKISDYLEGTWDKDILLEIRIAESDTRSVLDHIKGSTLDYPILNVAVVFREGRYHICLGALPGSARTAVKAEGLVNSVKKIDESVLQELEGTREEALFGSSLRATAKYRQKVHGALIARAMEVFGEA